MARKPRVQYKDAVYHVMSHSIQEFNLFANLDDFRLFVGILAKTQQDHTLRVFAYCLLHTHYHILLQTPLANLAAAMQQLNSVYANAYNIRKTRMGHVTQSRYSSRVIEDQDYFQRVTHYIISNPVAAGIVASPEDWPFSSCRATNGMVPVPSFLDVKGLFNFLDPFGAGRKEDFSAFMSNPAEPGWAFDTDLVLLRPSLAYIFAKTDRNQGVKESVRRWEYKRAEVAEFLGMKVSNIAKILKKFPDSA